MYLDVSAYMSYSSSFFFSKINYAHTHLRTYVRTCGNILTCRSMYLRKLCDNNIILLVSIV